MTNTECNHEWVDHWDAKEPEYICTKCEKTRLKKIEE